MYNRIIEEKRINGEQSMAKILHSLSNNSDMNKLNKNMDVIVNINTPPPYE